jgi:DMSO/TMAO reductase YedYZ molybdopterin-dependent catalytic subunit
MSPIITVTGNPLNAETPLHLLDDAPTPVGAFFVRCHSAIPQLDVRTWGLTVEGRVRRELALSFAELQALPYREVLATVECAGNGRRLMEPVPDGTPWGLGAVSTGVFGGTSLANVLERAGIAADAVEVVCEGADDAAAADDYAADVVAARVRFARSLPMAKALHPDTLLAWSLNGAPLTPAHGYPVRVFVPGWYGMASVKWVQRLVLVREPFRGHFQTERYVYRGQPGYAPGEPVREMQVRALITHAGGGAVRGVAWSGFGAIAFVEVSDDGGATWTRARLAPPTSPYAATVWQLPLRAGARELIARAGDSSGRVQPLAPVWNELGYANNVAHRVRVPAQDG